MAASGTGSGAFQTVRFFAEGDTTDAYVDATNAASKTLDENGQTPSTIEIKNTGTKDLLFSHDGTAPHGKVFAGETKLMLYKRENVLKLKSATAGQPTHYLVHAW